MSQDLSDTDLKHIWRQVKAPVIFRRSSPRPLLVRVPYAEGNFKWLRDDRRHKPKWNDKFGAWDVPVTWFDDVIKRCLRRYGETYVIQLYRDQQKCAPACWNAEGFHCECSCMGANHGGGHPGGNWYEVSETFAVSRCAQRYSCRRLRVQSDDQGPSQGVRRS